MTMPPAFRPLVHGDEPIAEAFLASPARSQTTMILRSNLDRVGLGFRGNMYEGVYVGAFDGSELVGVAAHYWNDNVVLGADGHASSLAREVVAASGRKVAGVLGRYAEAIEAQTALGLVPRHEGKEILFSLDLEALVVPRALTAGNLEATTPDESRLPMLLEWRMAYLAETMGVVDTPETRTTQIGTLRASHANGAVLLLDAGEPVAYTGFNASVKGMVQVGGVWTPPALRGRGYARCAVAASLLRKREKGAKQAILFTAETNLAAQKSYAALGFRVTGDYAILLFD